MSEPICDVKIPIKISSQKIPCTDDWGNFPLAPSGGSLPPSPYVVGPANNNVSKFLMGILF